MNATSKAALTSISGPMSPLSAAQWSQRCEENVYKSSLSSLTWKVPDMQETSEASAALHSFELEII